MRALVWFLVAGAALISAVAVCGLPDLAGAAHGIVGTEAALPSRSLAFALCAATASGWLFLWTGRAAL